MIIFVSQELFKCKRLVISVLDKEGVELIVRISGTRSTLALGVFGVPARPGLLGVPTPLGAWKWQTPRRVYMPRAGRAADWAGVVCVCLCG
jgi:hypothetical protein